MEVGGRRRTVDVERSSRGWSVVVGERRRHADLAPAGPRWSLLIGEIGGPTESHEVRFEAGPDGDQLVHVDGDAVRVSILDHRVRAARGRGDGAGNAASRTVVSAPMPGRVLKVLAQPGDPVAAGQGLVVVEAMKMENELRAPRAGMVTDVRVQEGATVDAGAVLVVIDAGPRASLPL